MKTRSLLLTLSLSILAGAASGCWVSSGSPTASEADVDPTANGARVEAAAEGILATEATSSSATEAPVGRGPLLHVHVGEKAAEGGERFKADWSFDLMDQGSWSAHVHVIPPGQLVPLHHHPENDELSWVALGSGEWMSKVTGADLVRTSVTAGALLAAPKGAAHGIRNRGEEDLVVVVVQRPSFGQNWYLEESDVQSRAVATVVAKQTELFPGITFPEDFFVGWELEFEGAHNVEATTTDHLYLNRWGSGSLVFEDKELPIEAGHFVRVPPGLNAQFRTMAATEPLTLVRISIQTGS